MTRHASLIQVRSDQIDEYRKLHAAVWSDVLDQIRKSNIRNYSIFIKQLPDGNHYLFSYFEYVGEDLDADMADMAADPRTQEWWAVCKPCHQPLPDVDVPAGDWWSPMEEVFHTD